MFREMRRTRQLLPENECTEILENGFSGVLAVSGDDGYPYAVPLNYVYTDGALYFHCALAGHKLDAIERCDKASFCVTGMAENVPEKFTAYYRSVIVFGRASVVKDASEKRRAIEKLAAKYSPAETPERTADEIGGAWERLCIVKLAPEHITGKQAIELVSK